MGKVGRPRCEVLKHQLGVKIDANIDRTFRDRCDNMGLSYSDGAESALAQWIYGSDMMMSKKLIMQLIKSKKQDELRIQSEIQDLQELLDEYDMMESKRNQAICDAYKKKEDETRIAEREESAHKAFKIVHDYLSKMLYTPLDFECFCSKLDQYRERAKYWSDSETHTINSFLKRVCEKEIHPDYIYEDVMFR